MTERSQPREQLAKALFRSGVGQLQQLLDDLAIPIRLRLVALDRTALR
jgi:hypothetical protein